MWAAMALAPVAAIVSAAPTVAPATESPQMRALLDTFMAEQFWVRLLSAKCDVWLNDAIVETAALRDLLTRYPGLRPRLTTALRTEISDIVRSDLPIVRGEIGTIFASSLNAAQITALAQLLATPAGREMIALALSYAIADEEADFTESPQFEEITAKLLRDPAGLKAALALEKSGAAAKLDLLGPKLEVMGESRADHLYAENLDRLRALAVETTAAYVAEQEAKAQLR